jgi:uncharacterized protein YdiU (UPF0061 family)
MRKANPAFIPRNHRVEEMIAAATSGDLGPFERLRSRLARPYEEQPRTPSSRAAGRGAVEATDLLRHLRGNG